MKKIINKKYSTPLSRVVEISPDILCASEDINVTTVDIVEGGDINF